MKNIAAILMVMGLFLAGCYHHEIFNGQPAENINEYQIGFYNVENLFDTLDSPNVNDEDFTPSGKYQWNTARYQKKLIDLATVIDSLPGNLPDVMGLCEIENLSVLQDLIHTPPLDRAQYEIIHKDSPDERGIDVALLVNTQDMEVIQKEWIELSLPSKDDPYTRDILHATLRAKTNKNVAQDLHVFVNHWPSRSGGQEVSEPNRIFAAEKLRAQVEQVMKSNPLASVVIVGDFNDHPDNISINQTLGAGTDSKSTLFNLMWDDHANKSGSYNYKGEWGALDQFIISGSMLLASSGWSCGETDALIYRGKFLLYTDKDGQSKPNRTYAGDKYVGGYSDHLPVLLKLTLK